MKKAIAIIILGLLLSSNAFAGCIEGDCRNGQGTKTWSGGTKYVGEFKDGKRHGQGTVTYANGDKYVGEFKDNNQHGHGTFTWSSGTEYVGGWKNLLRHGQGTMTWANGKIKSGIWEKGKLVKVKKIKQTREDKKIAKAQNVCRKIGFTPGTDRFLDCTVKMLTTTGGKQTVIVGSGQRRSIYPLHCRQMGGASNC